MSTVNDLDILSKYLSEEELKDIAKQVAYAHFSDTLNQSNQYAKSNLQFYIGQGALNAVLQYGQELDFDFHAQELKDRVSTLIKKLDTYNLPSTYQDIAKQYVEDNREVIQNKMEELMYDFVNNDKYPNAYGTFADKVGEQLGDMLYSMLEDKFKSK